MGPSTFTTAPPGASSGDRSWTSRKTFEYSGMARNVEIKARISNVEALWQKARALASEGPFEIEQDDTFFRCEAGRLKLRDFLDGNGEGARGYAEHRNGAHRCCRADPVSCGRDSPRRAGGTERSGIAEGESQ